MKQIVKGSIVKFTDPENGKSGYYKVTAQRGKKSVNLGSIFGREVYFKSVSIDALTECEDEWYEKWTKSETYQCM